MTPTLYRTRFGVFGDGVFHGFRVAESGAEDKSDAGGEGGNNEILMKMGGGWVVSVRRDCCKCQEMIEMETKLEGVGRGGGVL